MNHPPPREQRVARAMTRGLVATVLIALGGLFFAVLGGRASSDFLRGVSTGMLAVLPWAVAVMVWLGYRQLDEFGRLRQTQAAAISLVVVLLLAMTYYPLELAVPLAPLPLWILWVVGVGTYGLALGVMSARDGRAGD
ncbi:hypothetical protein [Deinococcus pimensis]|uniref:hypothetical protein n=1 Tax=Deinococcus pimensis TaxID=309888 RepID=UPI000487A611|nr:hypothetical protein [Deinococcus pimensis]